MFFKTFIKLFISNLVMKSNRKIRRTDGLDTTKNETTHPNIYENLQKQKLLFYLENEKIATLNKINELNNYNFKYNTLNITNGQLYKDWNFELFTKNSDAMFTRPQSNLISEMDI